MSGAAIMADLMALNKNLEAEALTREAELERLTLALFDLRTQRIDELEGELKDELTNLEGHCNDIDQWIAAYLGPCPDCDETGPLRPSPIDGSLVESLPSMAVICDGCGGEFPLEDGPPRGCPCAKGICPRSECADCIDAEGDK